jgi:hypothetical protein
VAVTHRGHIAPPAAISGRSGSPLMPPPRRGPDQQGPGTWRRSGRAGRTVAVRWQSRFDAPRGLRDRPRRVAAGRAKLGYTNVRERFEGREPVSDLMAAAQRHPGLRYPQLHHGGLHRQLGQVPPFTTGQDGLAGPMPRISCGRRRVTVGRSSLSAPRRRVCVAAWWASRRCRPSRSPTARRWGRRRRPNVGLGGKHRLWLRCDGDSGAAAGA